MRMRDPLDSTFNLFRPFFLPAIHLNPRNGVSSIERAKAYTENWVGSHMHTCKLPVDGAVLIRRHWGGGEPERTCLHTRCVSVNNDSTDE